MVEPGRTMQVLQVDERDSGWEDPDPRFRVYLHGSGATSTGGWTDTYDITGADVLQVIDWAHQGHRIRELIAGLALRLQVGALTTVALLSSTIMT
jgi:hypothetical protein